MINNQHQNHKIIRLPVTTLSLGTKDFSRSKSNTNQLGIPIIKLNRAKMVIFLEFKQIIYALFVHKLKVSKNKTNILHF